MALRLFRNAAFLAVFAPSLYGCAGAAQEAARSAVDARIATASIAPAIEAREDAAVILLALADGAQRRWENPESGARGQITGVDPEDGACLSFTTTRESFSGVHLYEGRACEDTGGVLRMRALTML